MAVAVTSVFALNAPSVHSEEVVSDKLSSSQSFSVDVRFSSTGGINAPSLTESSAPLIFDASGHRMTFDGSQIRVGNNQNVQIIADEIVFTGTLPGGEQSGAITVQTSRNKPAVLEFSNKVRFENANGVVLSTQGQGGTQIFFNQGLEIHNMTFGSASMLAKLQQVELYTTDLSFTKISSANRTNGQGHAFEIWGSGYLNVSRNEGVGTGTLSIDDFQGTHGLYIYGGVVEVENLSINNMHVADSSTSAVQGVYALGNLYISGTGEIKNIVGNKATEGLQGTLISDIASLSIHDVTSKTDVARGMRLYEQSRNSSFAEFGKLTISNIMGATKAEGLNMSAGTDLSGDDALLVRNLDISNIKAVDENGLATGLVVSTSSLRVSETARIANDAISDTYDGAFAADPVVHSVREAAVRVMHGGQVLMDGTDGSYTIDGTIVVGKGDSSSADKAGSLVVSGAQTVIRGDVYAGNGGQVDLTLTGDKSVIEGQIDDYHELATAGLAPDTVFHNANFFDDDGNEEVVSEAGAVKLTLNGSTWIARGQNFVDTVSFGENGGTIDLSRNVNSSATIENLSGSGTFVMELGAYSESGDIKTDMLYIQNAEAGSQHVIHAKLGDGVSRDDLENIRFATVKNGAAENLFVVKVEDQGAFNLTATVEQEDYQTGDADNERFNGKGDGEGDYKPGEDVVDAIFGAEEGEASTLAETNDGKAQNYYISGFSGGADEGGMSDAGQTILATARATYWNAVVLDRFNQRYGDRVYDRTRNGVWARVKYEHIGTDAGVGDFASDNTTYQFGYDYAKPTESGKMIWGGAIDYMNGRTDYDSINGDGGTDRMGALLYATYLSNGGAYADLVLRVGRLSADYEMFTPSGTKLDADYDHWMYGVSFEAGHQLENGTSWFIEPQVQAQYTRITDGDYSTAQTRVEQDSIDSLITRTGFRVGKFFSDNKATLGYFKADVMREWMGEQGIRVYDVTTAAEGADVSISNHGTWFDVGGGFQAAVAKDFYAYGDLEYRFGNDFDNTWIVNIGAKYRF